MTIIGLIVTLIVIGVLLWLLNSYVGPFIDPTILRIINVVVIIVVVLWLVNVFIGGLGWVNQPVPRIR